MEYWALFLNTHDPHIWGQVAIPIKVTGEYKYFYVCDVLTHRNVDCPFGDSKPYRMTIGKIDLVTGDIVVKEKI